MPGRAENLSTRDVALVHQRTGDVAHGDAVRRKVVKSDS